MIRYFLIVLLALPLIVKSQVTPSCEHLAQILKVLQEHHIEPRKTDQAFLDEITLDFLSSLDPRGLYFTEEDLKSGLIKITVADLENKSICNLLKTTAALYKKKLIEADLIIANALSRPLLLDEGDFSSSPSFKQISFSKSKIELVKRWEQWLSVNVLMSMYRYAQPASNRGSNLKQFMSYEKKAREKVKAHESGKIKKLISSNVEIESLISEGFFKSLTSSFDPHSEYFSNLEMKSFRNDLSGSEPSFGFDLKENGWGEIFILRVMPGGPAWNSNEIHNGDILLQVRKPTGDFIDVDDFDDPSELLKSWSEDQIELKLKKADGKIATVKLVKEKIESAENRVQGFVLSGVNRIGYVALPSFYKEWNNDNESNDGCANDLAKEIIKLKKENIEGLILDLRFNGGGSVGEAISVSGIFIDIGPVALVKSKDQPPYSLKDSNRGAVYDGPLLVMVNGASASASELVAATLQDYNRALIVGTSTFGKGTGQEIFPTNSLNNEFVKVTVEKLYRVTGKSNQKKGVVPDIQIPDLTDEFVLKERLEKHALSTDSVSKKLYYTPAPKLQLGKIKSASELRIKQNQRFAILDSVRQIYRSSIPLNADAFMKYMLRVDHLGQSMNKSNPSSNFKVTHNQFDSPVLKMDTYRKSISDESLTQINNSIFINEAYSILSDYINQNKN